ncbi:transmembrane protein 131-like [Clupea harengus]|uniref:Transmembrane protein 131-like n=1 Tax=Clupea harengus TaxID=7950 RepID=A0A6P3W2M7_CLUHA|nr:transmembrane protein 131-like [Clupea harengus]
MAGQRDFQQGSHCHRKTWINILLGILQLLLSCLQHGGAQLPALTSVSSVVEVLQADDVDFLVPTQAEEEHSKESLPQEESSSFYLRESGRPLRFQPPTLEFGTQPLGLPRAETVYIHNPSPELPVTLLSIFTSSRHFHMPFFSRRVIPPRGKTSFKLIFLPTEEGNVENSLFINTSTHGVLSYQVFGVGVPWGSHRDEHLKDSVLISPHIKSIKLTQTQEDASNITILGLHLDCSLPKHVYSHPQGSCLVSEEEEDRFSLLISLSERGEQQAHLDKLKPYVIENLMVLFLAPSSTAAPRIHVHMLNSGSKKLFVKDIKLLSKIESSLEFNQVLLRDTATNFTHVSSLSCKSSSPAPSRTCSRQISLQLLGNSSIRGLPHLHRSGVDLASLFQLRQRLRGSDPADLWFTNLLGFPLTITDVSIPQETQGLLKVVNFDRPVTVPSGCWRLFSMQLLNTTLPVNLIATATLQSRAALTLVVPLHIRSTASQLGEVLFETGAECARPCPLQLSRAGRVDWQRTLLPSSTSALWSVDSSLAAAVCPRWQNRKDQLPCRWPRLPVQTNTPLDFGATSVNESKVKSLTLKNPSGSVVSVEIRALSSYPAPLEALDLLTKRFNISPLSVNITTTEFCLLPTDSEDAEGLRLGSDGSLRLLLQPWESRTVSVAYTPAEQRPVTSILLIRNNLTIFDMVTVKGLGSTELLRVGGKLPGPGASLRFNVPQSTLMECRDGMRTNKPLFAIRKSFKVENAGELPLTVMSMNINGYKCQGFGFEVLQCQSFTLDYNSSSEITIAFTPDFTSSWVIRDLTLVTARGSSFPFTLNVTLPHHMLPLCAQVVPGPSWEESFWVVTLVFTCFSLAGVCLMAIHQAQYILSDFSSSSQRSNHNPLSRENGVIATISSNGVSKLKGSCRTYTDPCQTSDKGKGRGSLAVANGPTRSQSSTKKSSGGPAQPQKKHKVSVLYGKYKVSAASTNFNSAAAPPSPTPSPRPISPSPPVDEERPEEQVSDQIMDTRNNNNNSILISHDVLDERPGPVEKVPPFKEPREKEPVMFPMETHVIFPENPCPAPAFKANPPTDVAPEKEAAVKRSMEKRDNTESEPRDGHGSQRKRTETSDAGPPAANSKNVKRGSGKSRRKATDPATGVPEVSVVMLSEREREPEQRDPRAVLRLRNPCPSVKPDLPVLGPSLDSSLKQNGVCLARPRRKCPERRPQWESGSDSSSGSSSGSVRASRGSWGSWSSTSSMEGDRDANTRQHCANPARKRDNMQNCIHPADRESHQIINPSCTTQSMNCLYRKEVCQSPDPTPPVPSFAPSFAAVAAGAERNMDVPSSYVPEETWSAPSVPLTNEFRYNMTESLPFVPQSPATSPYNGFPWNGMTNQSHSTYPYSSQSSYMAAGNAHFKSTFPCHESQSVAFSHQPAWREDAGQEAPTSWDMAGCVGSKPYFSGTRSLSPMSSLFGSIWTPQSEPYQSHFHQERSAPVSPHTVSPHATFSREPGGSCPPKQYSSFNPFGPHMNLDIWNSSSSRSSNSQLSNDSGYCGDI